MFGGRAPDPLGVLKEERGRKGLGIKRGEGKGREGREGVGRDGQGKGGRRVNGREGAGG